MVHNHRNNKISNVYFFITCIAVSYFISLGFYVSAHPLNEFKEIFKQLKIISYSQFFNNDAKESLVSGTVMSIQEKKSSKGTPYAIIKFSDKQEEFELFLFSELLISNRTHKHQISSMYNKNINEEINYVKNKHYVDM